jgi:ribosomal protein S27AE
VEEEGTLADEDERPPICPACGVTMGMVVNEDGGARYVCLECGFSDEPRTGRRPPDSVA